MSKDYDSAAIAEKCPSEEVKESIRVYEEEKKVGKLKKLSSLADL